MKKFLLCVLCIVTLLAAGLVEAKAKTKADHKDVGKIIVIGYQNPKCDAVASAVAAADLLKQIGYDTEPMVAGIVDAETEYVLKRFGVPKPSRLENATGRHIFLVAHGGYKDAVKGAKNAYLRGIIDTYNLTDVDVVEPIAIISRPYGSTSTLINKIYGFEEKKISKSLAGLMMAGIISETLNLKADITTDLDKETVAKLAKRAGVRNVDDFAKEMFAEGWSWKGWSDENILVKDIRTYESPKGSFTIGSIRCHDAAALEDMKKRMQFFVPKYMKENNIEVMFVNFVNLQDVTLEVLPFGPRAQQIAAKAFESNEPGKFVLRAGKVSRRRNVLPLIRKVVGE